MIRPHLLVYGKVPNTVEQLALVMSQETASKRGLYPSQLVCKIKSEKHSTLKPTIQKNIKNLGQLVSYTPTSLQFCPNKIFRVQERRKYIDNRIYEITSRKYEITNEKSNFKIKTNYISTKNSSQSVETDHEDCMKCD